MTLGCLAWHALLAPSSLHAAEPAGRAATNCGGPAWPIEPLAPGLWMARAAHGEADAANRGRVSNLLIARDASRGWLVGSGPSPASARVLACQVRAQLGLRITDVISPWARPELVLGQAAFGRARRWAHADVAEAMAQQCPHCVQRLRQRLGAAAADLGRRPILLPRHRLHGDAGRLGPWRWWRLQRATGSSVTVWAWDGTPAVATAHGLLWADGPPDGRDADLHRLAEQTARLDGLGLGGDVRWLPEQGPLQDARAPAQAAAYWQQMLKEAAERVARGEAMPSQPPAAQIGGQDVGHHLRHGLNWQRAWRQAEDRALAPPPR